MLLQTPGGRELNSGGRLSEHRVQRMARFAIRFSYRTHKDSSIRNWLFHAGGPAAKRVRAKWRMVLIHFVGAARWVASRL